MIEQQITFTYDEFVTIKCIKCKREFSDTSLQSPFVDQFMIMHHMDCAVTRFLVTQGVNVETVGA